jgi:hypothetical protein
MLSYKYIHTHTYTKIYIMRKNKIVLMGLSEGTQEAGKGKKMLENEKH